MEGDNMPKEYWYDLDYDPDIGDSIDDDDVSLVILHTSLHGLCALKEELERIETLSSQEIEAVTIANVSEDYGLPFTHVKLHQNLSDYDAGQDDDWSNMPFVIFCLVALFVVFCTLYGFMSMVSDIFF